MSGETTEPAANWLQLLPLPAVLIAQGVFMIYLGPPVFRTFMDGLISIGYLDGLPTGYTQALAVELANLTEPLWQLFVALGVGIALVIFAAAARTVYR